MSTRTILAIAVAALCYFVMSSLVSQIGVASAPMAQHFDMEITEVVPLFSFLTGGSFAGIFISLFIFNYLSVRRVLLLFSGLLVLAAAANYLLDSVAFVPIGFAVMGIAGGVGMSAAAVTISSAFDEEHRASMLVGADLFYSAGGYLIVTLVALMATAGVVWSVGYLVVGGVSILIFCISLMADFPDSSSESSETNVEPEKTFWSVNAYLMGAAMFFYMMGQNAFIVWAPTYLSELFSVGLEEAGSAVSNYWGAGLVGLVISALVLQKITTSTFLVVVSAIGALLTGVFMFAESASVFITASALLGLVTIGSFGSMISLGVQQQDNPPINLVPFLLCCGSSGATISPVASSYIVGVWGVGISMKIIFSAYVAVFLILSFVTLVRNKHSDVNMLSQQETI
jgi:TsgA-like MFS transporter